MHGAGAHCRPEGGKLVGPYGNSVPHFTASLTMRLFKFSLQLLTQRVVELFDRAFDSQLLPVVAQ